jgi:hypothetical protein
MKGEPKNIIRTVNRHFHIKFCENAAPRMLFNLFPAKKVTPVNQILPINVQPRLNNLL